MSTHHSRPTAMVLSGFLLIFAFSCATAPGPVFTKIGTVPGDPSAPGAAGTSGGSKAIAADDGSAGGVDAAASPDPADPPAVAAGPAEAETPAPADPYAALKAELVKAARSLVGMKKIIARGVSFPSDCSGSMLAVFYAAGYDLRPRFYKAAGKNGVEKFYRMLETEDLLYDTKLPQPGDLVFWDDTYDRNGNGKADDVFCHVGIVTEVHENGDIFFTHYHYVLGFAEERMNLYTPLERTGVRDGKTVVINTGMRMSSWKPKGDDRKYASELYKIFGKTYALPEAETWAPPTPVPAAPAEESAPTE